MRDSNAIRALEEIIPTLQNLLTGEGDEAFI